MSRVWPVNILFHTWDKCLFILVDSRLKISREKKSRQIQAESSDFILNPGSITVFSYNGLLAWSQCRAFSIRFGRTAWKQTWPLNCNFLFSFSHIIPELSGARGETLQVCSQFTGTLQIAPLIFRCWPFGMTTIFSKTIRWEMRICSSSSKPASSGGRSSIARSLCTAWQGTFFFLVRSYYSNWELLGLSWRRVELC